MADELSEDSSPGLLPRRRLYLVATSHLDTQWRWTIQQTIQEFLPDTLKANFALFERFPFYVLSFEGAFRYMLVQEYYPRDFERLLSYVESGRWRPAGSMLDAPDANIPAPESLIRHVLYGNRYFEQELGRPSCDLFLPDGFGFGHALPSIAAHCGLKGFSSQKFEKWMAPAELPFDIGVWQGPDGAGIVAALGAEGYGFGLDEDLSSAARWADRIDAAGSRSGLFVGLNYVGVGDSGGALDPTAVEWIGKSLSGQGPIEVLHTASDQLFQDLSEPELGRLPRFQGELLLPTHGSGCLTSQASMKRWNRQAELLADAAERAAVTADWLQATPYDGRRLRDAWIRFLWHQMHDDLTGTCIPPAYGFSWNDELVALNQFGAILTTAVGALTQALDTRARGIPLAVYNPLSIDRQDLVVARLGTGDLDGGPVRVFGPDGDEVPAQSRAAEDGSTEVVFLARLPPVGWAIYDLRRGEGRCELESGLRVTASGLENHRYRAQLNDHGDLETLFDKRLSMDLLRAPAQLHLLPDRSHRWPAWEVRYEDVCSPPRERIGPPAAIRVVERGPARAALEVRRSLGRTRLVQRLRLAAADAGDRLEVESRIDWRCKGRLLKAVFPLAVSHPTATYDLGLGSIERGNNSRQKYEAPAQRWADLFSPEQDIGVSILTDSHYGWDKPDDSTLRLSLLRSPRVIRKFNHQASQDHGRHRFVYAFYGHQGGWQNSDTSWQAARLNQPLLAFRVPPSPGPLGKSFSLCQTGGSQLAVTALKKSETGDELIARVQETTGRPVPNAELTFAAPVRQAREVDGAERARGEAEVRGGKLIADFLPYQPRAFALSLAPGEAELESAESTAVNLPFDVAATSSHAPLTEGDFDGRGHTFPGEQFPSRLVFGGIEYRCGSAELGAPNALACRGQRIELPQGSYRKVHLLAASAGGDRSAVFRIGDSSLEISVQHYSGVVGRWKSWRRGLFGWAWARPGTGFVKRDPIAWFTTHRHARGVRDEPYVFCYLFRYVLDLPPGARSLDLPSEPRIRIFAVTLADETISDVVPVSRLYDDSTS